MMQLAAPTNRNCSPAGKQVGDTLYPAGRHFADVGQRAASACVRFHWPAAGDGGDHDATDGGGGQQPTPLVEVGSEPIPLRRSFRHRAPVRPTAAIIFAPSVHGPDTRDWSLAALPKERQRCARRNGHRRRRRGAWISIPDPKISASARRRFSLTCDKRETPVVEATPAPGAGAGVAPIKSGQFRR